MCKDQRARSSGPGLQRSVYGSEDRAGEKEQHDLILFSGSLYLIGAIRGAIIDELR